LGQRQSPIGAEFHPLLSHRLSQGSGLEAQVPMTSERRSVLNGLNIVSPVKVKGGECQVWRRDLGRLRGHLRQLDPEVRLHAQIRHLDQVAGAIEGWPS